ncbi:hypothetical protein CR513_12930, partial [Mucuna pruriens]
MALSYKPPPPPPLPKATVTISKNHLLWRQQVESMLKGHHLHHYLVNPYVPSKYLTIANHEAMCPCFISRQGTRLARALLAPIVNFFRCGNYGTKFMPTFTCIRMQRRVNSEHNFTTSPLTIAWSLTLVDVLTVISDVVRPCEQLDVILKGLLEDYESTFSLIRSKFNLLFVNEVETLLFAREACLDKLKKKVVAFINIVEPSPNTPSSQAQEHVARVSCQACHKYGHEASVCYHCFEENYIPNVPLDFMAMQWHFAPWNTYHYQSHVNETYSFILCPFLAISPYYSSIPSRNDGYC